MPKFKVLRGFHTEGVDENGQPRVYGPRDIVDSASNLLECNRPGAIKFAAVDDTAKDKYFKTQKPKPEPVEDVLEDKTMAQLRLIAEEEEIEVDTTMRKAELINTIRMARDLS